ncbi:MAG: arylsulfotransferase family protein, partial [Microlunatus sp.]|nr:arylsulfotransferase family protein [Microlunatus sp.]
TASNATPKPAVPAQFRTRPDLNPPVVTVTRSRDAAATPKPGSEEYIFLAPKQYDRAGVPTSQSGPMILDRDGHVVWFSPTSDPSLEAMDFRPQRYRGKQVLTWWEGRSADAYGRGIGVIADSSYRRIATVRAVDGLDADLHEFLITPRNTAYITAYRRTTTDLTAVGGLANGKILTGTVQEIDIATGRRLFNWDSLDHVDPQESYRAATTDPGDTMDYFHINSVAEFDPDTLLISSRNTWTVYAVAKSTGRVLWRLGGKKTDFRHGPGTRFEFQHHATRLRPDRLMIFDNAATPREGPQSRALVLGVDVKARTVRLDRALTHPAKLLANNQGSFQHLPSGDWFVGWGAEPYFSQYSAGGTLLLDGKLPDNVQSYRAFAGPWAATPTDRPLITAGSNAARGATVYVSWNGATHVDRWKVMAGAQPSALHRRAVVPRSGFETQVAVNSTGPYFQVAALDAGGRELGRSYVLKATL